MGFRIEDNVRALEDAAVYPQLGGGDGTVRIIQTHISVVALVGSRVFKFKKAVELPFLDFSTLERRASACQDELRLNRRMAPDVYVDVAPLRRSAEGLRVGDGEGEIVDWCVVMERLPEERMLDVLLENGDVEPDAIRRLARSIARFHREARQVADEDVRAAGSPGHLCEALRANFTELRSEAIDAVPGALLNAVEARSLAALPALRERLEQRARAGFVMEGHGDLHARNVCMTDPPTAFDCLEFRLELRAGDTATDLAFLVMDLVYRRRRDLAEEAIEAYTAESGDRGLPGVLPELMGYRAMVRAKVDAMGAGQGEIPAGERERLEAGARRHLRLAAWLRIESDGPLVLLASGLPATGKSTALLGAAREAGWGVVRTDIVRKELFGSGDPTAPLPDEAYSPRATARTYDEVLRRALRMGGVVLVDANYRQADQRAEALAAIRAAGRPAAVARFDCDEATIRARLRQRAAGPSVSDADEAVFDRLKGSYEPPSPSEGAPVVAVDAGDAPGQVLDALALGLLGPGP